MHCLPVLIAASVVLTGAASHALAQEPSRPTLTIARFEGKLKSGNTADAGADLADAIATRVEESGCCRVMLRAFLPQAAPGQSPSLEAIREAAVAGRVQYVVAGRAASSRAQFVGLPRRRSQHYWGRCCPARRDCRQGR